MKFMNAAKRFGSRVKQAACTKGGKIAALSMATLGSPAFAEGLDTTTTAIIVGAVALTAALGAAMLGITVTAGSSKQARRAV